MSAAALIDPNDGPLDPEDDAPGPSIVLRRGEAEQSLDILFGSRAGYVAMAFGLGPYRTAKGEYRHRKWREVRYRWPAERNRLLTDVASLLADADSDGPLVDVYVCPHLRSNDHRRAETGAQPGNALPPVTLHADLDGPPADPQLWAELDPLRVASGSDGHEHGFVMLDEPCESIARWYQLLRALRDALGGGADSKIADNDVLRLPGTINCKPTASREGEPPADPTPVSLLGWGGRTWTLPELAELLGVDLTRPAPPARPAPAGDGTAPATVPVPATLTAAVQAAVDGFAAAPDKSAQWARLIGCCLEAGYSRDQSYAVALAYGLPHIPRYADRTAGEFDRVWAKSLAWQARDDGRVTVASVHTLLDHHGLTPDEVRAELVAIDGGTGLLDRLAQEAGSMDALLRVLPDPDTESAPDTHTEDTEGTEGTTEWTLNLHAPTLDPQRAEVFSDWAAAQVDRHLTATSKGTETAVSVTEWARKKWGAAAPLRCRGRALAGIGYYPEAGLDADDVRERFVTAARDSGAAGLAEFTDVQLGAAFRAGWTSGLPLPMLPMDADDPRRPRAGRGKRGVLPGAEEMRAQLRPAAPVEAPADPVARAGQLGVQLGEVSTLRTQLLDDLQVWLHLPDPAHIWVALGAAVTAVETDTAPVWVQLVAASSLGKTECADLLAGVQVGSLGEITPAGLLAWSKGKAPRVTGLLAGITRGVVVFADFSTLLAGSERGGGRDQVFAMLRQVYDGHVTRTVQSPGAGEEALLSWQGRLTIVSAVTTEIDRQLAHAQALGERWLYVRITEPTRADQRAAARKARDVPAGIGERAVKTATALVLSAQARLHEIKVSDAVHDAIEDAALITAMGRATVPRNSYGAQEITGPASVEGVGRLVKQLTGLARGLLALGLGTDATITLVRRVALDSMPVRRLRVLQVLAAHPDTEPTEPEVDPESLVGLPVDEVDLGEHRPGSPAAPVGWLVSPLARHAGMDRKAVRRVMEEFAAIGLVEAIDDYPDMPDHTQDGNRRWRLDPAVGADVAAVFGPAAGENRCPRCPPAVDR